MAKLRKRTLLMGLSAILLVSGGAVAIRFGRSSPADDRLQEIKQSIERRLRAELSSRPASEVPQLLLAEIRAAANDDGKSMFTKEL